MPAAAAASSRPTGASLSATIRYRRARTGSSRLLTAVSPDLSPAIDKNLSLMEISYTRSPDRNARLIRTNGLAPGPVHWPGPLDMARPNKVGSTRTPLHQPADQFRGSTQPHGHDPHYRGSGPHREHAADPAGAARPAAAPAGRIPAHRRASRGGGLRVDH